MMPLAQPSGDDAHHALMPGGIGDNDALCVASMLAAIMRSASSRMPDSMPLRSRLGRSSSPTISVARAGSSVVRHSMPSEMSSSRPAALTRGPSMKPGRRRLLVSHRAWRPRTAR